MLSLLPLDWVVIDSPPRCFSSRMNGSAAQVMWVSLDGWAVLTFANGAKAGENWEIRAENLRKFCPLDESGYWASLWDACFSHNRISHACASS
jgi:hypothetical protein